MFTYFLLTYLFCRRGFKPVSSPMSNISAQQRGFSPGYFKISFKSILVCELFGPFYFNLGITSTYEYLEARFSRSVRLHMSVVFIVQSILYTGIASKFSTKQTKNLNFSLVTKNKLLKSNRSLWTSPSS